MWNKVLNGELITATYDMYTLFLNGWLIGILFFVFQLLLYLKTKNVLLMWVSGFMFSALFVIGTFVPQVSKQFMFVLLVLELAGILFVLLMK